MLISIHHALSIAPPPGTANLVLQVLLTPDDGPTQRVEHWQVEMPCIAEAARFTDAYGNAMLLVNLLKPEEQIDIVVTGRVETTDRHGVLGRGSGEPVPALYKRVTPLTKAQGALHGKFRGSKDSRIAILHGLMARVGEVLGLSEATQNQSQGQSQSQNQNQSQSQSQSQMSAGGGQSQSQSQGQSQSQDQGQGEALVPPPLPPPSVYAHAFIAGCRALDIPARYVIGYLADAEEDVPAFHAWAEAYDEGLGWIGFDPVLQLCPTDRHVRLAVGLDALSAPALRMVPVGDGVTTTEIRVGQAD